jgi:hypothetical protein
LSLFCIELESLSSQFSEWREEQLKSISEQIQKNIEQIQSPPKEKCENANKLYCRVPNYGFGSQVHSFMTCIIKGYYTKTLAVIDQFLGQYLNPPKVTWDHFIAPISETCQPNHTYKYGVEKESSVIKIQSISYFFLYLKFISFNVL